MHPPAKFLTLYLHPRVIESGIWCDECLLPSALRVKLYGISEFGVSDFAMLVTCVDCKLTINEK